MFVHLVLCPTSVILSASVFIGMIYFRDGLSIEPVSFYQVLGETLILAGQREEDGEHVRYGIFFRLEISSSDKHTKDVRTFFYSIRHSSMGRRLCLTFSRALSHCASSCIMTSQTENSRNYDLSCTFAENFRRRVKIFTSTC